MSGDLAGWLLEQVAADEATAERIPSIHSFETEDTYYIEEEWPQTAVVLAQCAALRRVVGWHRDAGRSPGVFDLDVGYEWRDHCCSQCGEWGEHGVEWPCATLLALAQPYAGRPGWRDEWAEEGQ